MRKMIVMICAVLLLMGLSITASAAISPTAKPVAPSETVEEIPTSPKTGDNNAFMIGMMTVFLSAGVVAVSLRKSK